MTFFYYNAILKVIEVSRKIVRQTCNDYTGNDYSIRRYEHGLFKYHDEGK
ncbi:hypothetical protein GCM10007183_01740 [Staphylococcus muscae]|uniref:Phage protein n=1 Tax=Staphylococcus muscae TaxID=1294 RepID=A0ABQ1HKA1_9STAP|nr:hypothetical protein GCM10007183_01740 [Staphylococcus muscae]